MNTWKKAVDESLVDLTGFTLINFAWLDEESRIIETNEGLIDADANVGTFVSKYYNFDTDEIVFTISSEGSTVPPENLLSDLSDIWSYDLNYVYPDSWIYNN